jgi:type VI secretion system secreted protein VgrG
MADQELQSALSFVDTKIMVKGKQILFFDLSVHEYLADVGTFSFNWQQPQKVYGIKDHIDFYSENLGQEVEISIGNSFVFKGIIVSINCGQQNNIGADYEISGKGLASKLEEAPVCKSFLKKSIKDITEDVLTGGIRHKINPEYSKKLYYTVQYNQSTFDFIKMLAARYGEWFYYDGSELRMGKPDNGNLELIIDSSISDWQIFGKMLKTKGDIVSTDLYSGKKLIDKGELSGLNGLYKTIADSGKESIAGTILKHSTKNVEQELLKVLNKIQQQGDLANSVFVSGRSYAVGLRLCTVIDVKLQDNTEQGKYRITEVHHRSYDGSDYINTFTAIPIDAEKPPYTNTELFPKAMAQPAEVTHNEDKDGLDRVKVKFPWHTDEENQNTPWIPMVQTHAGKDKGFRFLPEIGDKVMVGFLDDNAERPFILGTLFNEKEQSGIKDDKENNKKFIGTKSGRRLSWDEKENLFSLNDSVFEFPANKVLLSQAKDKASIKIESGQDERNGSVIEMKNEEAMEIGMLKGGKLVAKIIFDGKEDKITIESDGLIELKSKKKITMGAPEIEIKAQSKVSIEGTSETEIKGANVKIEAKAQLEAKGAIATFEGSGKADFKGGAMATLKGGIVMIN